MNNYCILKGHLGKDAEISNNRTTFSIAVSESYKDKQGEWQTKTDWINVIVWNKSLELEKGDFVLVEGKIRVVKKDEKFYTNIEAFNVQLIQNLKQDNEPKPDLTTLKTETKSNNDEVPF